MQRWMDDLVSDAQENVASCEDQSSEEAEDVKVCDICGDVGEEKKLTVCSRCNDGAEHIYCMRVMIPKVPEGEWLCEECQTEVEIGKEKKKLEKNQVKVATISSENKVEAKNVGNKELSNANQGNDTSSKRKEEDAGIIEKPEQGTCNVCCALCSSCVHRNCHSFHMESEVDRVPSGCTSTVKEEDSGSCVGGSEAVNKNKAFHDCEQTSSERSNAFNLKSLDGERHSSERCNNDVSCISEVKETSNAALRNKRFKTRIEVESSEEVEDQQVKVCDICGNVGEEEKLAVCSRCNDGAEHIYCMRVMIEEVPEVEWLCEACQTEVEIEKKKKKLEKAEVKVGASKGQSFEGQMKKPVNAANSSSSLENEMEAENVGNKESTRGNQGNCMTTKRKEEDVAITAPVRQNLPEPGGFSIEADSRKKVPLSRESSLKLDAKKGMELTGEMQTSLPFNALKNQALSLRGQLSKSISFNNSKVPKVKQLVNEVPLKPKNSKEPLPCITKQEVPMSTLAKLTSFKKPNSIEPANKAKSSMLPHAEEPRVMNPLMSRNVANNRGTSIFVCPSVTASMVSAFPSKAESAAQHLTKGNSMVDTNNLGIAHGQGGRNALGHRELKKPLLAKGHGGLTLTSAERSSGMLGSGVQRKVIQIPDPSSHRDEKIKNPPSLRPSASSSSRTMRCQRCNEMGHSTQFCAIDKFYLSAIKPFSEQTKDQSAKSNKTSEATTLVATEEAIPISADQYEQILKCGPSHNTIHRPRDILSSSFSHVQTNEQDMRNSLSTPTSAASTDCLKMKFKEYQTVSAMRGRSVDSSSTMSNDLKDKTLIFSSQGFSPSDERIASTVPELDYIWQGGFELWRTARSPELCEGLQAHLSCSASSQVLEVAKKFPSKIQLEELPCQNLWPPLFQENGPTYDSIGLFFFARDTHSYENHYSKLVENMLKDDLALRGNIETAELLIFTSSVLPKNFQRWNMFYYLWGVFRVRRKDLLKLRPDEPISKGSNLNEDLQAVDLSTPVFSSGYSCSKEQNNGDESDPTLLKSACEYSQCLLPLKANNQGYSNDVNTLSQPVDGGPLEDRCHDSITASFSTNDNNAINDFVIVPAGKNQKLAYSEHQGKMCDSSDGIGGEVIFDVNRELVTCSVSSIHEEESAKKSTTINIDNSEHLMDVDNVNATEVRPGNLDHISHVSGGAHKINVEMVNWANEGNGTQGHKKIKLDNGGSVNSS